jgi:miniconductance mechanosensitive channel
VKVQNWDKTITVLLTRKLITDRFKSWRGMPESGGRRIKRSLLVDQNTIRFISDDEAARLPSIGLIEGFLAGKEQEIAEWNGGLGEKAKVPPNRRQLTNIGTFRAYVERYLRSHKGLHQGMTLLVRQMQPTPEGLPIEVYCFAKTVAGADYEGIQSDIFDHLYSIMPEFSLRPFQKPAGRDLSTLVEGSQLPSLRAA